MVAHNLKVEVSIKLECSTCLQGSSGPHTEVSCVMEKVSEELAEMKKLIGEMPGYWHKTAEKNPQMFYHFLHYSSSSVFEYTFLYVAMIMNKK